MFIGFINNKEKRGFIIGREPLNEQRSFSLTDVKTLKDVLPGLFGEALSGVSVTADSAMGLSAVFSAVRVISEDLASVPLEVVQYTNGQKEKIKSHYLYDLLHNAPNHFQTPITFYENLVAMANLWGNAYAKIYRDTLGRPAEFEILHASKVEHYVIDRKIWYRVQGEIKLIKSEDMIHIAGPSYDGIAGVSMIRLHRETIGGGIAAANFGNTFFKNGASLNGLLTSDQRLDDTQMEAYSKKWNNKHTGGPDKAHHTAVLGQGLKYQPIGVPPEDAQYIETKKFNRSEIAGIYRVKPHKMADLEKATFSNIEHLSIEHVTDTIRPWAKRIEQELERKLIRENEKNTISLKFNLNALMRGDAKSRMEYYKGMHSIGAYSANDILSKEGENGYPAGDQKFIMLNQIPVDKIADYIDSKINQSLSKNKTNENIE